MALFDRSYTIFYWSVIVNIALSCTVFELFDVEPLVTGHSRSLKNSTIRKFGCGFLFYGSQPTESL